MSDVPPVTSLLSNHSCQIMGPVRRTLECSECGMDYKTIYRGRRPLCKTCRSVHVKDEHKLLASTTCSMHFTQLPMDVLVSLVPHLLMGHMPAEPYEWAVSTFMEDMLLSEMLPSSHCPNTNWRHDVGYVARYAWLPALRIRLVCKVLHCAVDAYLSSLLQPEPRCSQAAVTIQRAVKAKSAWFQEMQRTWAFQLTFIDEPHMIERFGIPSALLRRQRRPEYAHNTYQMVFGGVDLSVFDYWEPPLHWW